MKLFYLVAGLSAIYGVEAATESTITCSACQPPSSTNDIVTRSAVATPSCSGASFTIIPNKTGAGSSAIEPTGSGTATPTAVVPVAAGSRNVAGIAGVLVIAAVAPYLM
ncbi:uncharacterized protein TrAtP1_005219 [Trichoderma atroviride]|uniref:Uncharacterized protein n=1 Tax=Hypocrea atroviridis (strain ATCC 20476 / IMI 206040) TaxID=452589 RepID=G9NFR8_HYPAI|nr:uncharacterized protein TRIATDRAFT_314361 [Trichoderma atroviride IMI 206040]EHK50781.1 hypothetical protein TRIATDRAFT_314361 [Trichoderma atroviride IMI 206040]UKZ63997.1 hypothetical protein TrAtP1_005219 [Trichoderma atroviride]